MPRSTRPSPVTEASAASTSDRLKAVAIELFAKHGLDAVSVRDITGAANLKNAGSLNYYFRTKDELVRQIVVEVMGIADAYWKAGLDELLARKKEPSIRDLVRVLVSWSVPQSRTAKVPSTARFLSVYVQGRREEMRDLMRKHGYLHYDRILGLVRARMTGLPVAVVRQRLVFFYWSVTAFLAAHETSLESARRGLWTATDVVESFTDAMVGMLTAPVLHG